MCKNKSYGGAGLLISHWPTQNVCLTKRPHCSALLNTVSHQNYRNLAILKEFNNQLYIFYSFVWNVSVIVNHLWLQTVYCYCTTVLVNIFYFQKVRIISKTLWEIIAERYCPPWVSFVKSGAPAQRHPSLYLSSYQPSCPPSTKWSEMWYWVSSMLR